MNKTKAVTEANPAAVGGGSLRYAATEPGTWRQGCWALSFRSWRHSRPIGDTDSKRLAGYLEDPEKSLEMEEEKKAGEGGAFPARGDHCSQVFAPTTRALPAVIFVCCMCGAEGALGLAPPPRTNFSQLFPDPLELGKAIVYLDTKGNILCGVYPTHLFFLS